MERGVGLPKLNTLFLTCRYTTLGAAVKTSDSEAVVQQPPPGDHSTQPSLGDCNTAQGSSLTCPVIMPETFTGTIHEWPD